CAGADQRAGRRGGGCGSGAGDPGAAASGGVRGRRGSGAGRQHARARRETVPAPPGGSAEDPRRSCTDDCAGDGEEEQSLIGAGARGQGQGPGGRGPETLAPDPYTVLPATGTA